MCYRIKMGAIVIAFLSLTGCCRVFPCLPWCPPQPVIISDRDNAARIEIKKNREMAKSIVSEIKQKFKGKETKEAYIKAQTLYRKAMSENNAWVSALTLSIENNEKVEGRESFEKQSKAAAETAGSFLAYGESLMSQSSIKTAGFPSKGITVVAELIAALVSNGITIWKENIAQQAAERTARAKNIREELNWSMWTEIK